MENDQILSVLTEILEEQKNAGNLLHEIHYSLLNGKAMNGKGEFRDDSLKFDEVLKTKFDEMKLFLDQVPKVVEVKNRYLFFPEHSAKEYYSSVFRWIFYMLIGTYCCWIIRYAIWVFTIKYVSR
jgi:hypothetical protein